MFNDIKAHVAWLKIRVTASLNKYWLTFSSLYIYRSFLFRILIIWKAGWRLGPNTNLNMNWGSLFCRRCCRNHVNTKPWCRVRGVFCSLTLDWVKLWSPSSWKKKSNLVKFLKWNVPAAEVWEKLADQKKNPLKAMRLKWNEGAGGGLWR